jgi:peptidoglycan hydrolase-like protein with peptidoglycan-binding domain
VPPAPPAASPGRSNQDVQAPRENQDVQSPRERDYSPGQRANQDVQSPRDTQDRQTERGQRMSGYHTIRSGQEALKSKGFDPGEIDGRYGPNTQAAISKYQRENGLRETGRFDKATLNQLGVNSERVDTTGSSSRRNRSN